VADDPRDRSRAYVAAGVLFFDDTGRVLLVQPTYKDYWDIPGGYVETGETPAQTAAREIHEELGIKTTIGPCWSRIGHHTPTRATNYCSSSTAAH
jgi:8-oxo-dGTP diphosphatase